MSKQRCLITPAVAPLGDTWEFHGVNWTEIVPKLAGDGARMDQVTAPSLDSKQLHLNGKPLRLEGTALHVEPASLSTEQPLNLAPASYAFVVYPAAAAPACLE